MKGILFNIQRYSIQDGPGIRTTVFFKGCPLNCRWCANPESKLSSPQILYTQKNCVACGTCVSVCPAGALRLEDGQIKKEEAACIRCGACVQNCPVKAMTMEGKEWSVDEVMEEVLKDRPFYEKSGGGVTLSGGEPLMQSAFAAELLRRLHEEQIHTAMETSGYASPEVFRKVFERLDLLYIDFKHPLSSEHRRMTDMPNEPILNNIAYAASTGRPMVVRMPMIPGFNNSPETAEEYLRIFQDIGVKTIHLLPFHQLGQSKWHALHIPYEFEGVPNMSKADLEPLAAIYRNAGLNVQIGG